MAPWGHLVDEAGRILKPTGNGQVFMTQSCSRLHPGESGKGNCLRTNQGSFWWGFPPKFKKTSKRLSLESSMEGHSGAESSYLWGGNQTCFCVPLFVFCSGGHLFPRKVLCQSSKLGLADSREKKPRLCLVGTPEFLKAGLGIRGRSQGAAGQLPQPLLSGPFQSSFSILPPPPTTGLPEGAGQL